MDERPLIGEAEEDYLKDTPQSTLIEEEYRFWVEPTIDSFATGAGIMIRGEFTWEWMKKQLKKLRPKPKISNAPCL